MTPSYLSRFFSDRSTTVLLVPFEIVAFILLLEYWTTAIPAAAVIVIMTLCYTVLHLINVRYFGITEMWMSTFKFALMVGLLLYTFVVMVGGNPLHDRFGFHNWKQPVNYSTTVAVKNIKTDSE